MLLRLAVLTAAACLGFPAATAGAGSSSYTFDGGTKKQRETVAAALRASSFDWSVVPGPIAIHIVKGEPSRSIPGEIWLDADLLDAGEFAWGVVQHEYAHQVDYLLFDDLQRSLLLKRLGGRDWCYARLVWRTTSTAASGSRRPLRGRSGPHRRTRCGRPVKRDESAAMAPAKFRALVSRLTGQAGLNARKH